MLWELLVERKKILSGDRRRLVSELLQRNRATFSFGPSDLERTNITCHHIDIADARPIKQPLRGLPLASHEAVEGILKEMKDVVCERPSHKEHHSGYPPLIWCQSPASLNVPVRTLGPSLQQSQTFDRQDWCLPLDANFTVGCCCGQVSGALAVHMTNTCFLGGSVGIKPAFAPYEVSVLAEVALGHLRYHLTDVPPQSHFPPAVSLDRITQGNMQPEHTLQCLGDGQPQVSLSAWYYKNFDEGHERPNITLAVGTPCAKVMIYGSSVSSQFRWVIPPSTLLSLQLQLDDAPLCLKTQPLQSKGPTAAKRDCGIA
ncbi:hypothetical protein PR048_002452 [Dryococelus australis]|uniref:Uncharacterized protein n=1 Tax=Dryococelus australis TaxID=614101 RepID=A0ABQ9IK77_9NEOP|nr:hypothetical protein PR048_002452 [Dryococelus australis]